MSNNQNKPSRHGIKSKNLGCLSVDAGDVVCFSMDSVIKLASLLGRGFGNSRLGDVHSQSNDIDEFIKEHEGVCCEFGCDGGYGVNRVHIISPEGECYDGVLIGGCPGPIRLLPDSLPSYGEFVDPRLDSWEKLSEDYKNLMVEKVWNE